MANTKQYSIRQKVLDKYLQKGWYSANELRDYCNKELEENGYKAITSRQTFYDDIGHIESQYKIIIEQKKKGRKRLYHYKNNHFSIYKPKLNDKELNSLRQAFEVLNRFKGLPQFEWIAEFEARFETNIKDDSKRSVIAFQDSTDNTGMEHFTSLFDYIVNKNAIDITYRSFKNKDAEVYSISPYYLKQYNNRWFLIGRTIGFESMGVFALDRIEGIGRSGKAYEESETDFDEYFKDVIGVSKSKGNEVETVEIWFSNEQLKYVETKPLHKSQKVMQKDNEGGVVEINVIINYELEQNLLSFGEKAKVLSPKHLKDKIKYRIAENLKKY